MTAPLSGAVSADGREPLLPLVVLGGASGAAGGGSDEAEVHAIVDTGFDGELQLPPELVRRLGYPYLGTTSGTLADGSVERFDYHLGRVLWYGAEREVVVIVSNGDPLVGMALLGGSRLKVDVVPGGAVRIEELS